MVLAALDTQGSKRKLPPCAQNKHCLLRQLLQSSFDHVLVSVGTDCLALLLSGTSEHPSGLVALACETETQGVLCAICTSRIDYISGLLFSSHPAAGGTGALVGAACHAPGPGLESDWGLAKPQQLA